MFFSSSSSTPSVDELEKQGYKRESIYGYTLYYKDEDRKGMQYLNSDLQSREVKPLFEYAQHHKSAGAEFEDDEDRDYTIKYVGSNKYMLERRSRE
jgi:hypothetical protein